jgi:hypothetical protein
MKLKLIIIGLVVSVGLLATEATNHSYNRYAINIGEMAITDHYLSNQEYKGLSLGLDAYHTAYYNGSDSCVSWLVYDHWRYGRLINASYSAMIQYIGGNAGFASYYNWHPTTGLKLMAGGAIDIYGAFKNQSRNVNNPASGDIQINLMASVAAQYKLTWNKWALSFDYMASTPLIGGMFVPEMGQSYYEIYLNLPQSLNDVIHFTSFHNRQGIKGNLSINFVLPTVTLSVGMTHNHQWWQANHMNFYLKEFSGQVGIALNLGIIKE